MAEALFEALENWNIGFKACDLKANSFSDSELPHVCVYFNQASPSAYLRDNVRTVPFALSLTNAITGLQGRQSDQRSGRVRVGALQKCAGEPS